MPGMTSASCGIARHDRRALDRVRLHHLELFLRQRGGLADDAVVHADLADVVEQRREPDPLDVLGGQAHLLGDRGRVARDPLGVAARVRVLGVDRLGERPDRGQEQLAVLAGGPLDLVEGGRGSTRSSG